MKTIEDKLQSLPAEIKTALNAVAKKLETAGASNGVWTKTIKKALMKVGNDHGYVVCTSGVPKADWGEWLYDMCWLKHKKDKVYDIPINVPLIMESEWATNQEEIIVDFQKLLICKAQTKLLIFQDNADLVPYLKKSIKLWDDPAGTYLLAQYDNTRHVFQYTIV